MRCVTDLAQELNSENPLLEMLPFANSQRGRADLNLESDSRPNAVCSASAPRSGTKRSTRSKPPSRLRNPNPWPSSARRHPFSTSCSRAPSLSVQATPYLTSRGHNQTRSCPFKVQERQRRPWRPRQEGASRGKEKAAGRAGLPSTDLHV